MGRFGAVFGPRLGGQLLASGNGDWGFTAFAIAGLSSMVLIGIAALRSSRQEAPSDCGQNLVGAHRPAGDEDERRSPRGRGSRCSAQALCRTRCAVHEIETGALVGATISAQFPSDDPEGRGRCRNALLIAANPAAACDGAAA